MELFGPFTIPACCIGLLLIAARGIANTLRSNARKIADCKLVSAVWKLESAAILRRNTR